MTKPISDERLRNTLNWAEARLGQLSGAEVIVGAIEEVFQLRDENRRLRQAVADALWRQMNGETPVLRTGDVEWAEIEPKSGSPAEPPEHPLGPLVRVEGSPIAAPAFEPKGVDPNYKLPCEVRLPPSMSIGKGCPLSTLLTALRHREQWSVPQDLVFQDERAMAMRRALSALQSNVGGHLVSNEHEHATYVEPPVNRQAESIAPMLESLCPCNAPYDEDDCLDSYFKPGIKCRRSLNRKGDA